MRKFILISIFLVIISVLLDVTLVRNISGVWVYGNVLQAERPGHAYIQQEGNSIQMFMVWTPNSKNDDPHYAIDGYISNNVIYGSWSNYIPGKNPQKRDFRAEISSQGDEIRIFGTNDPLDENQLNFIVMSKS